MENKANTIESLLEKHVRSNNEEINVHNNLNFVKKLITSLSTKFDMRETRYDLIGGKVGSGTINTKSGCNYSVHPAGTNLSLYFRVEHYGIQFNNEGDYRQPNDEKLILSVINFCNQYVNRLP